MLGRALLVLNHITVIDAARGDMHAHVLFPPPLQALMRERKFSSEAHPAGRIRM